MRYLLSVCLFLLSFSCCADDENTEAQKIGNLLEQRLPAYVKSMPIVIENSNQEPYKWVGRIRSLDTGCTTKVCNFYTASGCLFEHPRVVLTAAHVFFNKDGTVCNHDYYWCLQAKEKIVPGKTKASKIRKVVLHSNIETFSKFYLKSASHLYYHEDIACAILYEDDSEEFAVGYEPDQAQEAATSDRFKFIAGYFSPNDIYGLTELGLDRLAFKMRATPPTRRKFERIVDSGCFYSSGGRFKDLQSPEHDPIFLVTKGCSGAPVFVQDTDGSWKVSMVFVGQSPGTFRAYENKINDFLNNTLHPSDLPYTHIVCRILSQSFYENIWVPVMDVIKNDSYSLENIIDK